MPCAAQGSLSTNTTPPGKCSRRVGEPGGAGASPGEREGARRRQQRRESASNTVARCDRAPLVRPSAGLAGRRREWQGDHLSGWDSDRRAGHARDTGARVVLMAYRSRDACQRLGRDGGPQTSTTRAIEGILDLYLYIRPKCAEPRARAARVSCVRSSARVGVHARCACVGEGCVSTTEPEAVAVSAAVNVYLCMC